MRQEIKFKQVERSGDIIRVETPGVTCITCELIADLESELSCHVISILKNSIFARLNKGQNDNNSI